MNRLKIIPITLLTSILLFSCGGAEQENGEVEEVDEVVEEILLDSLEVPDEVIEQPDCNGNLMVYLNDPDTKNPTNIRKSPGGEVVLELAAGEYWMTVVEADNGWFKIEGKKIEGPDEIVEIPADEGWIHGSVISVDTRNYGDEVVELHEMPSVESPVVGSMKGVKYGLRLRDMCGEWIEVEWKEGAATKTGWVEAGWLCGNPLTTCS